MVMPRVDYLIMIHARQHGKIGSERLVQFARSRLGIWQKNLYTEIIFYHRR